LGCCLSIVAAADAADEPSYSIERNVVYAQREERAMKADVYVPNGPGPFPAVLVVHGGAWAVGHKTDLQHVGRRLAEHRYTAVLISYRLAPKHKFPAQLEDCLTAIRWMRSSANRYKIDTARIGGYGYSAGGHLMALVGTTADARDAERPRVSGGYLNDSLQAVVVGGGPCDFRGIPDEDAMLRYWLNATRAADPTVYEHASPARFVSANDPPMFFFHGTADKLVPLAGVESMAKSLQEVGVPAELCVLAGQGHLRAMFDEAALSKSIAFLDRHLKGQPTPSR
jgi:acetyl esterase/lipase